MPKGNQGEHHRRVTITGIKSLPALKEPLICENPECPLPGRKFYKRHARTREPQKHCSRSCQLRHAEIKRGRCARAGCPNYRKNLGQKYCSQECHMAVLMVPRKKCARPGCENMTKRGTQVYCSQQCWDQCIDYKALAQKGVKAQAAYRETHEGSVPKLAKRSNAVRRNNMIAPPRRKMRRTGRAYGYEVIFEPEAGQYRAYIPDLPGIIVRHKRKNEALFAIRRMMREQGIAGTSKLISTEKEKK